MRRHRLLLLRDRFTQLSKFVCRIRRASVWRARLPSHEAGNYHDKTKYL